MSMNDEMNSTLGLSEATSEPRFFYGWKIVFASVIGLALGVSTTAFISFGIFITPLEAEFGWSRVDISIGYTIMTCTTVIVSPLVGVLVDKFGVRKTLIPSIALLSLAMASMALLSESIWHFYAMCIILPIAGCVTLPVSYSRILVNWFVKHRGLALGIGLSGVGLGAAILPQFIQTMMGLTGFRGAYLGLAGAILIIVMPVVASIIRERPQDLGLLPDGRKAQEDSGQNTNIEAHSFRLSEILAMRTFWLMAFSFLFLGMTLTGIVVHLIPMLIDSGIEAEEAAYTASVLGLAMIAGRTGAGYLMDRFFAPYVAIAFLLGPVIGLSLFAIGAGGAFAFISAGLIGLALGAEFDVVAYFTSRYFRIENFGRMFGIFFAIFFLGASIGPLILSLGHAHFNHYNEILWCFAGIVSMVCFLFSMLGPYPGTREVRLI